MPAHGAAGGLVGQYAVAVVLDMRDVIKRAQQRAGIKDRDHAVGAICSPILHYSRFDGSNPSAFRGASFEIDDCSRTPAVCPEHLFARVGDLHRGASRTGGDRRNDLQRDDFALATEAATHQRLDHSNLGHRHFEHERQLVLQVVRNLGGRPDGQASRLTGLRIDFERGQSGVRLHGGMCDFIRDVTRFSHAVCFLKTLFRIAKNVVIIFFDVVQLVIVDEIGFRLHRLFRIEVGWQHLVLDVD